MPLFMTLAWIYTLSLTVKAIVWEKERKLTTIMYIGGLDQLTHWLSWLVVSILTTLPSVTIVTLLLSQGGVLR